MNRVRLIRHEAQPVAVMLPDRFEFNPQGRLRWLQRLLFAILRWLRANAYDAQTHYTEVEVHTEKILDAVMQNASDAESLYFQRAKYIVMGPRDFARFADAGKNTLPQFMQFNFDARIGYGRT